MRENIKNIIKKLPFFESINTIRKNRKIKKEYLKDYLFFKKNYLNSKPTEKKIGYDILLIIHALEKGMSHENPRPFGKKKIIKLIELIKKYDKYDNKKTHFYSSAISCLYSYKLFYENHSWCSEDEYNVVVNFLNDRKDFEKINIGTMEINYTDIKDDLNIDYSKFLKSRRSIRNFADRKLLEEDIKKAVDMAILSPSACNRQMCKIYYAKSEKAKNEVLNYAQGLSGFVLDNINFFVVTFDVNANYFVGERNQGWFNAGLISMNFVNALHSLGIGSCFLQFGNTFKEEEELKKQLGISTSERIAVLIAAGYYDEVSRIPYSTRKSIDEIYRVR